VLTNRVVDLCGIELFLRRFFGESAIATPSITESVVAAC
jgi:hypothetical protein